MSQKTKIPLGVNSNQIKGKTREEVPAEQLGFLKEGKGTSNAIFAFRLLAETAKLVKHEELMVLLDSIKDKWKDLRLIYNLY